MTTVAVASTSLRDYEAGEALATAIRRQLNGDAPNALIVFASPENDFRELLRSLESLCRPGTMIGCSSAGEFGPDGSLSGGSSAIALRADDMFFKSVLATRLSESAARAARILATDFEGHSRAEYRCRTALVLVAADTGHAEVLVEEAALATEGTYQFIGAGAGDDSKFVNTDIFFETEVHSDAVVALEILSNKPIGIGARHGWQPATEPLRATEVRDSTVVSFDGSPAIRAFERHAASTGQEFDHADPAAYFVRNVIGTTTADGYRLRVPLSISDGGAIDCAARIPQGSIAHIMSIADDGSSNAAAGAVRAAVAQVEAAGHKPGGAVFFDCVATRTRLGPGFDDELHAVAAELRGAPFAGCNSYGQIVRAAGQFGGFHNCTAAVCVFPA